MSEGMYPRECPKLRIPVETQGTFPCRVRFPSLVCNNALIVMGTCGRASRIWPSRVSRRGLPQETVIGSRMRRGVADSVG